MNTEEINKEMLELQRLNHKFNMFFAFGVALTIIIGLIRISRSN